MSAKLSSARVPGKHNGNGDDEDGGWPMGSISAEDMNHPLDPSLPVDCKRIYFNLWLFIWLKTIGSYDSGAFSAALGVENGIAEDWELSLAQQGALTSSVFLGNILGCPLAGHFFSKYNEKYVLGIALVVHTAFTFLCATFSEYHIALFNRFFIGLTLAFIVVYTPVWVDAFAPKERQSIWMASHNAGVPLGIMFGYLLGAIFPSYTTISWEWAFYIKCILMVPTVAYVLRVDSRSINAKQRTQRSAEDEQEVVHDVSPTESKKGRVKRVAAGDAAAAGGGGGGNTNMNGGVGGSMADGGSPTSLSVNGGPKTPTAVPTPWRTSFLERLRSWRVGISAMLFNSVFMSCVLAMSAMYFVATGLQNFVTQYLRDEPFNASMKTIILGFGVSVVTAPVCGVIAGGILLDRLGGYHGNLLRVSIFALCWGSLASMFAVICIFAKTTAAFLMLMSIVLFCGGALIPPAVGLTMSSLPEHLRSAGAAFSQTFYNLLGNYSGPMVCGLVSQYTGALKYGIATVLACSVFGILPIFVILCIAIRQRRAAPLGDGLAGDELVTIETLVPTDDSPTTPPAAQQCESEELPIHPGDGANLSDERTPRQLISVVQVPSYLPGNENAAASPSRADAVPLPRPPTANSLHSSFGTRNADVATGVSPLSQGPQSLPPTPHAQPPESVAKPVVTPPKYPHVSSAARNPLMESIPASAASSRRPSVVRSASAHPAAPDRYDVDVEMINYEVQGTRKMGFPTQYTFGVDLVRSWLLSQSSQADNGGDPLPPSVRSTSQRTSLSAAHPERHERCERTTALPMDSLESSRNVDSMRH